MMASSIHLLNSSCVLPIPSLHAFRLLHRGSNKQHRFWRSSVCLGSVCFDNPSFILPVEACTVGLCAISSCLYVFSSFHLFNRNRLMNFGEWILFSSDTSFNQFVITRCPTISLEARKFSNFTEARDRKRGVKVRHGAISTSGKVDEERFKVEYQRFCVLARDGGVISLDWPANLVLEEERDLDITLLLVPSTMKGSMDKEVQGFVNLALEQGIFPIVMNPRGCAGSPLSTPRLFTAADSDDISTTVEFINKARPWATMCGVGWGYGSNMITKYLAEVGDRTPLAAVTCFNALFDMKMASAYENNSLSDLKETLRSNKSLFQGRGKGFNVEKALTAKSFREFDEAISMVPFGFDLVEDFYSFCFSNKDVARVKIPVIFVQSNDELFPEDSISRSLIDENPFASLLLCYFAPNSDTLRDEFLSWRRQLSIEWLRAVEFSIWKGVFPSLPNTEDDNRNYEASPSFSRRLKLINPPSNLLTLDSGRDIVLEEHVKEEEDSDVFKSSTSVENFQEEQTNVEHPEKGNAQRTAEVVMNMLDATLPDVLNVEKKEKVMEAVARGENLVNALQDAVPEDVREKLASSVSVMLQTQKATVENDIKSSVDEGVERLQSTNLNFESVSSSSKDETRDLADICKSDLFEADEPNPDEDYSLVLDTSKPGENEATNPSNSIEENGEQNFPGVETIEIHMIDQNKSDAHVSTPQSDETKNETKANQKIETLNSSSSTFDVVQALDALSGIDDSTQVAVNSVFGVIEDIISEMEEKKDDSNINKETASTSPVSYPSSKQPNETNETKTVSIPDSSETSDDIYIEVKDDSMSPHNITSSVIPSYNHRLYPDFGTSPEMFLDYIHEDGQWKLLEKNSEFSDDLLWRREQKRMLDCSGDRKEYCHKVAHVLQFARKVIIHTLTVVSLRKMGVAEFTKMRVFLHKDIEKVATQTSLFMLHLSNFSQNMDHVSRALAFVYWKTSYLKRILPLTVVVGASISSLRKHLNLEAEVFNFPDDFFTHADKEIILNNGDNSVVSDDDDGEENTSDETKGVMVGAVTAAIGASALLTQKESLGNSNDPPEVNGKEGEENQNNIVASLAEKAMQVAAPVVPKTEAGEIDERRLVAMLADLGKKGGALRLVGKVALLWGGIRGAMSLTDKLILFLRISDRPLYQRVLGFVAMVLLLWSPLVVPFLPSLIQGWIDKTSVPFAEFVCIIGLYAAVTILVVIWGRRIHNHEDPFKEYGFHFSLQGLSAGFLAGVVFVLLVQTANALLGFATFRFYASFLPPNIKRMLNMMGSVIVSTCVILVEELLFRSWLPEEIAADLGYARGIIISASIFSVLQRDLWALPGLFFFSMVLSGLKKLFEGNLSICVGLRSGIVASSFALHYCGYSYQASSPVWATGSNPLLRPITNPVGIAFTIFLVVMLRPYYNEK